MQEKDITLTNLQLLDSAEALQQLGRERVPVKLGFALSTNRKRLRPLVDNYQEFRVEVLKRHAKLNEGELTTDETGQVVFATEAQKTAASTDIKELNNAQVTVKAQLFTLTELEQAGVSVASGVWDPLDWMIEG